MRANRVVVGNDATTGTFIATFYKTHKQVGILPQAEGWQPSKDAQTKTAKREEFRKWAIDNASTVGVEWLPEYQAQAWDRQYWKYENDQQVEEDAITLMQYTIRKVVGEACNLSYEFNAITLDSIIPNDSNLSYIENGKYIKNGNWAVATVNLDVDIVIDGKRINIIYPIEMRSGQLTKIKLTKSEVKAMIADSTGTVA